MPWWREKKGLRETKDTLNIKVYSRLNFVHFWKNKELNFDQIKWLTQSAINLSTSLTWIELLTSLLMVCGKEELKMKSAKSADSRFCNVS